MTKIIKKATAVAVALAVCAGTMAMNVPANAAGGSSSTLDWPQFLGAEDLKGVSDAKTPRSLSEMERKWTSVKNESDWDMASMAAPVVLGDAVYYCYRPAKDNYALKLVKVQASDGTVLKESALVANGADNYVPFLGSGGGLVFMATCDSNSANAQLHAFDADTLDLVWSSEPMAGGQVESPICYHDGYVYTATYGAGGGMYCYDVAASGSGVTPTWKMEIADNHATGFLWAGVEFVGDACVFGHSNGTLYAVDYQTGTAIDTYLVPAQFLDTTGAGQNISATPNYYEKNGRLYITVSGQYGGVLGIRMNRDGSFDESDTLVFQGESGLGIKSSAVIYNDRVYVTGSGGGYPDYTSAPFRVLDANTLEQIYSIPDIVTKGTVVLTTAYATADNNQQVYLYLQPYEPGGTSEDWLTYSEQGLYIIKDSAGQTTADYERVDLAGLGVQGQYCATTLVIGPDGSLYVNNDSGNLWCVGNSGGGQIAGQDVYNQIARLPEVGEYAYYSAFELRRIAERYDMLSGTEQAAVTNYSKLTDILSVADMSSARLVEAIDALPDANALTIKDAGQVEYLYQVYCMLTSAGQGAVVNAENLKAAYAEITALRYQSAIDFLIGEIAALPEIADLTLANGSAVPALVARLTSLPEIYVQQVTNAEKLMAAQTRLAEITEQLRQLDELVQDTLTAPITQDSKAAIDAALKLAEGLAAEDLKTITSYEQYLVPAVIDYINLLTNQMYDENRNLIAVTMENKGEISVLLEQIYYYLGFVPETELRYVDGVADLETLEAQVAALDRQSGLSTDTPKPEDTRTEGTTAPATGDRGGSVLLPMLALGAAGVVAGKRKRAK